MSGCQKAEGRGNRRIILRPAAGLANRIRSIASAIVLCEQNKRELEIVWFKDHALQAAYSDLFEPLNVKDVFLREARFLDFLRYDVPYGRRNLKLPLVYQALAFRAANRVGLWEANRRSREGIPFSVFADSQHSGYVASGSLMASAGEAFSLFTPKQDILDRTDEMLSGLDIGRCLGVHVRRGDHRQATENSPVSLFEQAMRDALAAGQCDCFYLASDSEEVKARLRGVFGARLQTSTRPASRTTVEGVQDAVAEMWALSKLPCLLGSCGSTFALTASQIGRSQYRELSAITAH